MRAVSISSMKALSASHTSVASWDIGRALSGEWGPETCGSSRGQVYLDHAVEEQPRLGDDLVVGGKEVAVTVGCLGEGLAAGRTEVRLHAVVVCKNGGGGSQLGAHVGDRRLAGAAYGPGAWSEVLDDGVGAA